MRLCLCVVDVRQSARKQCSCVKSKLSLCEASFSSAQLEKSDAVGINRCSCWDRCSVCGICRGSVVGGLPNTRVSRIVRVIRERSEQSPVPASGLFLCFGWRTLKGLEKPVLLSQLLNQRVIEQRLFKNRHTQCCCPLPQIVAWIASYQDRWRVDAFRAQPLQQINPVRIR